MLSSEPASEVEIWRLWDTLDGTERRYQSQIFSSLAYFEGPGILTHAPYSVPRLAPQPHMSSITLLLERVSSTRKS